MTWREVLKGYTPYEPEPKPAPKTRMVKGHWVSRDWYRWFIATFDRGVIWFYRSDVVSLELVPPYEVPSIGDPWWMNCSFPRSRIIHMHVDIEAREHPEGTDW